MMNMLKENASPIKWAPKVKQDKLRRLYENDARGMRDDELLNDVAFGLYSRCVSILEVTDAVKGRVKCHGCAGVIPHAREDHLRCPACGWEAAWKDYQHSYQEKQLFGGAALPFFQGYVARFHRTNTHREKMLAIDDLIHQFHWYHKANQALPEAVRPAAANLIEGRGMREVLQFLDALTYGEDSTVVRRMIPDR